MHIISMIWDQNWNLYFRNRKNECSRKDWVIHHGRSQEVLSLVQFLPTSFIICFISHRFIVLLYTMIQFVVPKPVKKIKRSYTPIESDKKKVKVWFRFFSVKIIRIIFIVFVLIYWGFLLFKNTLFAHEYTIKRVMYDSGDVARYDDPYMYRRITNRVRGENYHVVKWYRSRIVKDMQSRYPMVSDVQIDYLSSNTISVKLSFTPIDMVIRNQEMRWAIVGNTLLPLYSWNKIANNIKILDMPPYLSGMNTMSWLFYKIPATGLVQQIELLYQGFPGLHHIEYLAWGERSIVFLDGKKYYINNLGDIPNQIRNYQLLKKYYKEFNSLSEIDLWSLEKDKVIVSKF